MGRLLSVENVKMQIENQNCIHVFDFTHSLSHVPVDTSMAMTPRFISLFIFANIISEALFTRDHGQGKYAYQMLRSPRMPSVFVV